MCDDTNWTRDDFVADADAAHSALAEENQRLRNGILDLAQDASDCGAFGLAYSLLQLLPEHRRATAPTRPADADPDISGVPV